MPAATTAPAPPPPAPTPPKATPVDSTDNALSDIYADIEALDEKPTKVEPPKGAKAGKTLLVDQTGALQKKTKPEEEKSEVEEEEEETQPAAKVEEPQEEEEVLPRKTRDLKTVYLDLKKRHKELETKFAEREKKLQEIEQRSPEEASAVLSKLEAAEKRRQELEDEIRFVNYTKSAEFRDKYAKPYEQAWAKAVSEISELTVETADGETRPATAHDLLAIANMPLGQARKVAVEMFGAAADDVMAHRRIIKDLSDAQGKALEDAQKNAAEHEKTRNLEMQAAQANRAKNWKSANEFLESKWPKAYQVDETDPDDKGAHLRGFALADLLYAGPQKLSPEQAEALPEMFKDAVRQGRPLNEGEMIKLHALARLKMANEPRLAARLKKAQAKVKELEKSLKAYESSEPPSGKAGKGTAARTGGSWVDEANAEIEALDDGR